MIRFLLAALLIAFLPSRALAWGEYGHRLTASIAWHYLTPAARAEVRRLLAKERLVETPGCELSTIQDASVWPDCIRAMGDRFSYTAPWHYQNIHVCKPFDVEANCPNDNCVSAQVERHARLLANPELPDREKLMSLAFLVHFVGDMHQPLHAGDAADLGGNRVRAAYGVKAPERMNLHRIWDSDLAERSLSEPPGNAEGLIAEITAEQAVAWVQGGVADWMKEAWAASGQYAYGKLDGVNVCEAPPRERVMVDERYIAETRAKVREQAKKAGVRLALMLNAALAPIKG
jgi:hypothetical protein